MDEPRSRSSDASLSAVVFVLAAVMAGVMAWAVPQHRPGLWLDEVYSLELSRGRSYAHREVPVGVLIESGLQSLTSLDGAGPVMGVWRGQQADLHPPLYFLALRCWREVFGGGVAAARGLSVLCYAVAAGCVAVTACRGAAGGGGGGRAGVVAGVTAAVVAAVVAGAVMALSVPGLWYATEIRGYAMSLMWVALCTALTPGLAGGRSRRAVVGWAAAALGAGLTHYFAGGAVVGLAIAAVAAPSGLPGRVRAARVGAALALAATPFAALWLPSLALQLRAAEGFSGWITPARGFAISGILDNLVRAPALVLGAPPAWAGQVGLGLLTALGAAGVCAWRARRGAPPTADPAPRDRTRLAWAAAVGAGVGALCLVAVTDFTLGTTQLWHLRYLMPALPALAVATGLTCAGPRVPAALRLGAPAVLALAGLGHLQPLAIDGDWNDVVNDVRQIAPPTLGRTLTVFTVERTNDPRDVETTVQVLTLLYTHHSKGVPGPVLLLDAPATPDTLAAMARYDRLVVVTAWRGIPPDRLVPGWRVGRSKTVPWMGVSTLTLTRP